MISTKAGVSQTTMYQKMKLTRFCGRLILMTCSYFVSYYSKPAFFKLWCADHKWSSGSVLVVLGLTFYEINYPAYIVVLL
jgi:hypothetical protein